MRDRAYAAFAEEVASAEEALLALLREDREREWDAYDLKTKVRNGWSAGAVSLAFDNLLHSGAVEWHGGLIRLAG